MQVQVAISSYAELSGVGGGGITQESLRLVGDGTLDMANIYTGYVSGALPPLKCSLSGAWGRIGKPPTWLWSIWSRTSNGCSQRKPAAQSLTATGSLV